MIELSPPTAIVVYLFLTLMILLGIWGFHYLTCRNKKVVLAQHELYICEYCNFIYLDQIAKTLSQCPQCRSFNKMNRYKSHN